MRSLGTATKSSPHLLQLEKACMPKQRPSATKNKINLKRETLSEALLQLGSYNSLALLVLCTTKLGLHLPRHRVSYRRRRQGDKCIHLLHSLVPSSWHAWGWGAGGGGSNWQLGWSSAWPVCPEDLEVVPRTKVFCPHQLLRELQAPGSQPSISA